MDVEGSEWGLLDKLILPESVLKVTIECHFPSMDVQERGRRMAGLFKQFESWQRCSDTELSENSTYASSWHKLVRFWRDPPPART